MNHKRAIPFFLIILTLILAACSPGIAVTGEQSANSVSEQSNTSMSGDEMAADSMEKDTMSSDVNMQGEDKSMDPGDDMMETQSMTEEEMSAEDMADDQSMDDSMMNEMPLWMQTDFINVNTGETFQIGDFKGKVVLVETLATWCSNCLKQQKEVKALHGMLMTDDLVSIGIDIDLNENAEILKNYVQNQGFDWVYTIATAETAREIGNLYGAQFLNPPSTPILIIDRHGEVHLLPFGIKSAEELKEAIEPFLNENM